MVEIATLPANILWIWTMRTIRHPLLFPLAALAGTLIMASTTAAEPNDNDSLAKQFIARHEATVRPLERESCRCWWEANTTGSDAAFQKKEQIETRLNLLLANREKFAELKAIHKQPVRDPLVARQIAVLYLQYLAQQIDPALIKEIASRSNTVEKAYSVYRARGRREGTDRKRGPRGPADVPTILPGAGRSGRRARPWGRSSRRT